MTTVRKMFKNHVLALQDLTSTGGLYKDRFLSRSSDQVLTFHLFRHGTPDEHLTLREHDITFKLRMSSVIYVHTHRFYSELMSFFFQFQDQQSLMNRVREAAAVGGKVKEIAARGESFRIL